jgi:hypothetical protein
MLSTIATQASLPLAVATSAKQWRMTPLEKHTLPCGMTVDTSCEKPTVSTERSG